MKFFKITFTIYGEAIAVDWNSNTNTHKTGKPTIINKTVSAQYSQQIKIRFNFMLVYLQINKTLIPSHSFLFICISWKIVYFFNFREWHGKCQKQSTKSQRIQSRIGNIFFVKRLITIVCINYQLNFITMIFVISFLTQCFT